MSDDMAPDLTLVITLVRRLIADVATVRDDITVLTAIAMRQDTTLSAVLTELRAMHSQHSRLADRVRSLETASEGQI